MGTQFSKIKLSQRVELHGEVITHAHSEADLFTRRAHHSGVLSGHELLSYSFLRGSACEPRRSLRRRHRSRSSMSVYGGSMRSRASSVGDPRDDREQRWEQELDHICCKERTPDSELDSGISVNVGYDNADGSPRGNASSVLKASKAQQTDAIRRARDDWILAASAHHHSDDDGLDDGVGGVGGGVGQQQRRELVCREVEINAPISEPLPPLPDVRAALKRHYREYFSDWFEPSGGIAASASSGSSMSRDRRRSSRRKNLHQKLVLSQMSTKKATKLDMDDRAKMVQYFTRASCSDAGAVESVKIESMFGSTCWAVPSAGPPLPTVITVQAPAGIGKSSMLKYMCMKWGCGELWTANFDMLLFVECRTLNRLGSMTGRQFLAKVLEPIDGQYALDCGDDDALAEVGLRAAAGRVLLLLDGLDEVHGVGQLNVIRAPAGNPDRPGLAGKGALDATLSPLEFTQCLLTGALLHGCHVIVTSRPHTLSHLQSSRWFLSLPKRMVSLDIQGLSEEGVQSFIHSYVDARMHVERRSELHADDEHPCFEDCACQPLQKRARADPYIFSLATNPFYLWLICTIFSDAGEEFIPRTLTQLYTWVMLVFANRWQNTSLQMTTSLDSSTVDFLLNFSRICYSLVKSGNIKMSAYLSDVADGSSVLSFPDLADGGVTIDQYRAESFGLMTIDQEGRRLECEFRHLSLAEYLTALHVHVSGDTLTGFPRDRKELILQYLSGLASASESRDQMVVKEFLHALGSRADKRNAVDYLKCIQKMKGEWYNRQGLQKQMLFMRCAFESRQENLDIYPFPGLKIISIRGSALLALDLIVIGSFVARLSDNNRLLELSLRDYPLDRCGLEGLLPCLPLVRTVTLCARKLTDPDCYRAVARTLASERRLRMRELWLLDAPAARCDPDDPDLLGAAMNELRETCRLNSVRVNV